MDSDVIWFKITFIFLIFVEAILAGFFPTYSRSCRESPLLLAISNCFAAGVFLAIALVHILPEEAQLWGELYPDADFPLPYFLVVCGFVLILTIDKVIFESHAFQ